MMHVSALIQQGHIRVRKLIVPFLFLSRYGVRSALTYLDHIKK